MRLAILLSVAWIGCANRPPPVTPQQALLSANCVDAKTKAIDASSTCTEAQLRVDVASRSDAST